MNFPLILALVLAGTAILGVLVILVEAREAAPPRRVLHGKQAPLRSAILGRIGEFDLCTETSTDVAGMRRGRPGL